MTGPSPHSHTILQVPDRASARTCQSRFVHLPSPPQRRWSKKMTVRRFPDDTPTFLFGRMRVDGGDAVKTPHPIELAADTSAPAGESRNLAADRHRGKRVTIWRKTTSSGSMLSTAEA